MCSHVKCLCVIIYKSIIPLSISDVYFSELFLLKVLNCNIFLFFYFRIYRYPYIQPQKKLIKSMIYSRTLVHSFPCIHSNFIVFFFFLIHITLAFNSRVVKKMHNRDHTWLLIKVLDYLRRFIDFCRQVFFKNY